MTVQNSYENRLLKWLAELDAFLTREGIHYALFGGAGLAAYLGHLPRRLHDLDYLLLSEDVDTFVRFVRDQGFESQESFKSKRAHFGKFVKQNHVYQLITSVFPGRFTLLDVNDESLKEIAVYDFTEGIVNSVRRPIKSLQDELSVTISAVPFEDLLISKLWPTFEPSSVHDLLLLLSCEEAALVKVSVLTDRLEANPILRHLCAETLEKFEKVYRQTAWYRLNNRRAGIEAAVHELREAIISRV